MLPAVRFLSVAKRESSAVRFYTVCVLVCSLSMANRWPGTPLDCVWGSRGRLCRTHWVGSTVNTLCIRNGRYIPTACLMCLGSCSLTPITKTRFRPPSSYESPSAAARNLQLKSQPTSSISLSIFRSVASRTWRTLCQYAVSSQRLVGRAPAGTTEHQLAVGWGRPLV